MAARVRRRRAGHGCGAACGPVTATLYAGDSGVAKITPGMAIERCRIWWPRQQLQLEQGLGPVTHVLFGWIFTGAGCVDAVVSAAVPQEQILRAFATLNTLQSIVSSSDKRMPVSLQESASFIILGDCVVHHSGGLKEGCCSKLEQLPYDAKFVQKENFDASRNNVSGTFVTEEQSPGCNDRKWVCDLGALDGFLDAYRKSAVKEGTWMHLFSITGKSFKRDLNQVPVLHHLYLRGQQIEMNHCHVILYDVPTIGRNHFSIGVDVPRMLKASSKKPNWINDLQKKPPVLDLGPIVLALNCSSSARPPIALEYPTNSSQTHLLFKSMFDVVQVTWNCMGIFLASTSTFLYIMILLFRKCLGHKSLYLMLQKIFNHSWNNLHLRSCQILYWPIVLQDTSLRSRRAMTRGTIGASTSRGR